MKICIVAMALSFTLVALGGCAYPRPVPRACPPGFHLGPLGQRCLPN